jgi:hypothetical protein
MANFTDGQLLAMIYASTSFLIVPGLIGWYFEWKREEREGYGEVMGFSPPPFRTVETPQDRAA